MVIRPGIELANLTDVGCVRAENEDYYAYFEPEDDDEFRQKGRLAVVADGMGGHEGGQVASGLAVDTVRESYSLEPGGDTHAALVAAFARAHAAIQAHAQSHPELRYMGTTCTAAVLRDAELHFAHIGDSRLYLLRGGHIAQVTHDHSFVNRLLEAGRITREEAANHPDKNVLTAAMGIDGDVPADFSETPVELHAGDVVLMCTDGLHGLVSDEELLAVASGSAAREACQRLVDLAKERGGFDNITVQILRVGDQSQ